jgi:hypothetical protein
MADRFAWGKMSLVIANDRGLPELYQKKEELIHLYTRDVMRPWQRNELQANVVFAFGETSPVMIPMAVANAGGDRLVMHLESRQPFYLWERCDETMAVDVHIAQLASGPQRIDLEHVARDFDGRIVGQGSSSHRSRPLEVWRTPIQLKAERVGPLYLDVVARTDRATVNEHVCLGSCPSASLPTARPRDSASRPIEGAWVRTPRNAPRSSS